MHPGKSAQSQFFWALFNKLLPENAGVYCYKELDMVPGKQTSMCAQAATLGWAMVIEVAAR